jgi:DNA-binding CsgD family transcriptional regulator/PAS domain-containing protein
MMPELDPALIGSIYDASLDANAWERVLGQIGRFLDSAKVSVGSYDLTHGKTSLCSTWGQDPYYLAAYNQRLQKFSPLVIRGHRAPIGVALSVSDIMPYEEFQRTVFYQEWTAPQGHVDALKVNLAKSETEVTFVVAGRHRLAGRVDEEMRRRMDALTPHLRRAVRIRDTIGRCSTEAAALADTLDAMGTAILLVDEIGRIAYANAPAEGLLAQRMVIKQCSGRLSVIEPRADKALLEAIEAARSGDTAVGAKGIALSLGSRDKQPWIADVLPLTPGTPRSSGRSHGAVAAIFVRKAGVDLSSPSEAFAKAYRLTSGELRVLMAVIEIGGLPKVARTLGISETTVKTHLHRVFAKTGTNRQADLVRLVAGFVSPVIRCGQVASRIG